jgi:hypothetical protein
MSRETQLIFKMILKFVGKAAYSQLWEIVVNAVAQTEQDATDGKIDKANKATECRKTIERRLKQIKSKPAAFILNFLIELAVTQMNVTGD